MIPAIADHNRLAPHVGRNYSIRSAAERQLCLTCSCPVVIVRRPAGRTPVPLRAMVEFGGCPGRRRILVLVEVTAAAAALPQQVNGEGEPDPVALPALQQSTRR